MHIVRDFFVKYSLYDKFEISSPVANKVMEKDHVKTWDKFLFF